MVAGALAAARNAGTRVAAHAVAQKAARDVAGGCADGHAHRDFPRALTDGECDDGIQPDAGQQERDESGTGERGRDGA